MSKKYMLIYWDGEATTIDYFTTEDEMDQFVDGLVKQGLGLDISLAAEVRNYFVYKPVEYVTKLKRELKKD